MAKGYEELMAQLKSDYNKSKEKVLRGDVVEEDRNVQGIDVIRWDKMRGSDCFIEEGFRVDVGVDMDDLESYVKGKIGKMEERYRDLFSNLVGKVEAYEGMLSSVGDRVKAHEDFLLKSVESLRVLKEDIKGVIGGMINRFRSIEVRLDIKVEEILNIVKLYDVHYRDFVLRYRELTDSYDILLGKVNSLLIRVERIERALNKVIDDKGEVLGDYIGD